jgi:hypothetical protein
MDLADSFAVAYHFRLLYWSGSMYPIVGALRHVHGGPWEVRTVVISCCDARGFGFLISVRDRRLDNVDSRAARNGTSRHLAKHQTTSNSVNHFWREKQGNLDKFRVFSSQNSRTSPAVGYLAPLLYMNIDLHTGEAERVWDHSVHPTRLAAQDCASRSLVSPQNSTPSFAFGSRYRCTNEFLSCKTCFCFGLLILLLNWRAVLRTELLSLERRCISW